MVQMARLWCVIVAGAVLSSGCVKGLGEPCKVHSDCEPGLACGQQGECSACGDGVSCLGIDLVVKTCDPTAPDVFAPPVTAVRVTVEGDAMLPFVQIESVAKHSLELPELEFGTNRRITVEALEDVNGPAVARGVSAPFDLSAETPTPAVTVFVRPTSKFSQVNGASEPTSCSSMVQARADHTATRLADGRVLVAGGYTYDDAGERVFLKAAELYDPRTGLFTALPATLKGARAGHTAHLLPDGRVLLIGGYVAIDGVVTGLRTVDVYDPASSTFSYMLLTEGRMEHASAMLPGGVVVVAGGVGSTGGSALKTIEVFRPNAPPGQEFTLAEGVELATARAGHAALTVSDDRVLFIGGADGSTEIDSVEGFGWLGSTLQAEAGSTLKLGEGRAEPSAVLIDALDGPGVLVVGAPASGTRTLAKAWDWLSLGEGTGPVRSEEPGAHVPTFRFLGCVAPFPGGALVAGGVEQGASEPEDSNEFLANADVYRLLPSGVLDVQPANNALLAPRKNLVCTTLSDGSVLITGGEGLDSRKTVTAVAEIFQP